MKAGIIPVALCAALIGTMILQSRAAQPVAGAQPLTGAHVLVPAADTSAETLLTRAELLCLLHAGAGSPVVNFAMPYEDVAQSAPYAEAVHRCMGFPAGL